MLIGFEAEFFYLPYAGLEQLAKHLENEFSTPVRKLTLFDHRPVFDETTWFVCEDSSLRSFDERAGLEIISPPTSVETMIPNLRQTLRFIRQHGVTNENCALHFTMSNDTQEPDVDRIVRAADDSRWLRVFGRDSNTYAVCAADDEERNVEDKYYSINIHQAPHLVEFKHPGSSARLKYEQQWPLLMVYLEVQLRAFAAGFKTK